MVVVAIISIICLLVLSFSGGLIRFWVGFGWCIEGNITTSFLVHIFCFQLALQEGPCWSLLVCRGSACFGFIIIMDVATTPIQRLCCYNTFAMFMILESVYSVAELACFLWGGEI